MSDKPKDLLKEEGTKPLIDSYTTAYDLNGPNVRAGMILTDDDLVATKIVHWSGFGFKCKVCGIPSVLHFMKYCGNCGSAVSIQSDEVTEYLNNKQERY